VTVRVGGECFPPGMKFTLWGDGVTAPSFGGPTVKPRYEPRLAACRATRTGAGAAMTYPRKWESTLTIAADAPLGQSIGASVAVGRHAACDRSCQRPAGFIETEPNSEPERAERITLPVVVNGQIAGERDLDSLSLPRKAGEVVVLDVLAARIGSPPRARSWKSRTSKAGHGS